MAVLGKSVEDKRCDRCPLFAGVRPPVGPQAFPLLRSIGCFYLPFARRSHDEMLDCSDGSQRGLFLVERKFGKQYSDSEQASVAMIESHVCERHERKMRFFAADRFSFRAARCMTADEFKCAVARGFQNRSAEGSDQLMSGCKTQRTARDPSKSNEFAEYTVRWR